MAFCAKILNFYIVRFINLFLYDFLSCLERSFLLQDLQIQEETFLSNLET